ncbi:MAG: hypothetical protein IJW00_10385 [Clostridia bacterium]|nr:hypothetical protein [Clostridia bacterium]
MYYSAKYITKWHDTDPTGVMRPSRILEYMQETANLQCREYGMDLNDLFYKEGLGFLLSRLQLRVNTPLHAYEEIEVRTWCPPSRALSFLRCFAILRGGEVVAEALSTWALMDVKNKTLVKVSDFDREFPMGDPIDEATLPKKVRISAAAEMETVGERHIVYSDLDFNFHMNNTKYPDMVCDFLPDMKGKYVSSLSLAYMNEAAYGNTLTVQRTQVGEGEYLLRTVRGDSKVCLEAAIGLKNI